MDPSRSKNQEEKNIETIFREVESVLDDYWNEKISQSEALMALETLIHS
jgi:hypothetical protein